MSTDNITELEGLLAEARRREQEHTDHATQERAARETAYRRQRLADHDPRALLAAQRAAQRAFLDALEADPVFSAFAEAQAARWRENVAKNNAHADRVYLAQVDGTTPPHDSGVTMPPDLTLNTLLSAVSNMVSAKVQEFQAEADRAFADAVFGADLTPEQILAAEAEAEAQRRREAAQVTTSGYADVTGMSDAERTAADLPTGSTRRQ